MVFFSKLHGLKISAQVSHQIVNFFNITLDLNNGKFSPYRKPDNEPQYVNRQSNHPPSSKFPNLFTDVSPPSPQSNEHLMLTNLFTNTHLSKAIITLLCNFQTTTQQLTILTHPAVQNKSAKEISSGTTHLLVNQSNPTSPEISSSSSINTFQLETRCISYLTGILSKSVTAACLT